jgi:hydroxymethylglutaryl-CoA reductase
MHKKLFELIKSPIMQGKLRLQFSCYKGMLKQQQQQQQHEQWQQQQQQSVLLFLIT